MGVSRDRPKFLSTPYYLRIGYSYGLQIWPVHVYSQGRSSKQKPIKNLGEKGAWAYAGNVQFLSSPLSQEGVKL